MFAGFQVVLVKLFTVPFAPLTRTLPALILPVTPSIATLPALIVLFTPLIVTALVPSPAFTIPFVPSILTALLPEPNVTVSFNATVYVLAFVTLSTVSSTLMFLLPSTFVLDAAFTSFNCLTFTASLSSTPAVTFLICVLLALKPFAVTNCLLLIVKPSLLIVV